VLWYLAQKESGTLQIFARLLTSTSQPIREVEGSS